MMIEHMTGSFVVPAIFQSSLAFFLDDIRVMFYGIVGWLVVEIRVVIIKKL
jgi:hypothetical protein